MRRLLLPGLGVAAALALSGCDSNGKSGSSPAGQTSTVCGTYSGKGCAPANKRVDLAVPSFSHSTEITNPLFPISHGRSAVLLGHVDGKPFRTETTVLPGTQTVDWNGRRVPVLISQYMAYLDGRLDEVAIDRYAQADDGSVWYLGEDVFDYRKGAIAITEGTWLAGREGPAAMIMSAHAKLGDVFRPENAIGIVFEEVTVTSVGKTVAGPRGPVAGAILTKELHSDRTTEDKLFAPGYGEFRTSGGGDLEALALEVPTDAVPGASPTELESLSKGANGVLELSRIKEWEAAAATIKRMNADWATLSAGNPPPLIASRLTGNLTDEDRRAAVPSLDAAAARRRCGPRPSGSHRGRRGARMDSRPDHGTHRPCGSERDRCAAKRTPWRDRCKEPPRRGRSRSTARRSAQSSRPSLGVDTARPAPSGSFSNRRRSRCSVASRS